METTQQRDQMRSELEALKQKVLEELKEKSAELEKEAEAIEKERDSLQQQLIKEKENL